MNFLIVESQVSQPLFVLLTAECSVTMISLYGIIILTHKFPLSLFKLQNTLEDQVYTHS